MRTRSRPGLHLTDSGGGAGGDEPVLLITGWTISSAVFDPILPLYTPHARVVTYDHRGSGRSAPWPAWVSMAMLAADAARALDDRGIVAAHVVGLSMGAMVGLELAVRMPARVKSLVLVGGGAGGPLTRVPPSTAVLGTVAGLAGDAAAGRWPASVLFSRRFREEHPDRVVELVRPFARHRPPPWTTGFQTVATSCFARAGSLARVRAPTLVLHGDEDAMSPVANAVALADGIPGARLHLERGCGHAVPLERPEATATLLLGWVAEHADLTPRRAGTLDRVGERVTRPFSLHAGMLRNTRDLTPALARRLGWPG